MAGFASTNAVRGRYSGPAAICVIALLLAASPIQAAPAPPDAGPSEIVFVLQILALLIFGRLLSEAMIRIGQPAVMGQLIAGLVLGPSLFGALWPDLQHALFPDAKAQKAMLDGISQFGILLLLLLTGMETDLKLVRQTGRASMLASLFGILIPFACGVALGEMLPESMLPDPSRRLITSLFLGLALSIASVKIVAMVLREMNFTRRVVGQVLLTSAIIDDSIGWIIVAIIFSLAMHGAIDAFGVAQAVIGTLVFMALSFTIGRRLVFFAIRWVNDTFKSEFAVITAILIIMCVMAMITHFIGVHTVLGAFVAGILIGESPILTRHIDEQLRGLITAFFMPIFFGTAGINADLTILKDPQLLILTCGLILIASIGKFGGAFLGAELGGLTRREGLALACGMNARGSTEVIVATVGLSMGALSQNLFSMIVTMAVATTMAMPPTLRWALSHLPLRKEEKQRLEREEMEEKGFVSNLERLLLAVDQSANGKFAARVAGALAGTRGLPITLIQLQAATADTKLHENDSASPKPAAKAEAAARRQGETVKQAAAQTKRKQNEEEKVDFPVAIKTILHPKPEPGIVAEEARKGYGILFIGVQNPIRNKQFHPEVEKLALEFDGPLAVSAMRDALAENPRDEKLSILVPVNGTEPARRAAEVAITLARASNASLTALYVATRTPNGKSKSRRGARMRRHEEDILKDIAKLAEGYKTDIRTAVRTEGAPEDAILKQTESGKHNIVIMGVGRRPSEKLFFGETAAAILERSKRSILFVAS